MVYITRKDGIKRDTCGTVTGSGGGVPGTVVPKVASTGGKWKKRVAS